MIKFSLFSNNFCFEFADSRKRRQLGVRVLSVHVVISGSRGFPGMPGLPDQGIRLAEFLISPCLHLRRLPSHFLHHHHHRVLLLQHENIPREFYENSRTEAVRRRPAERPAFDSLARGLLSLRDAVQDG